MKIKEDQTAYRKKKGKEKCEDEFSDKLTDVSLENRLSTLDIFAGCGGLSAGLQHSGKALISQGCSWKGIWNSAFDNI